MKQNKEWVWCRGKRWMFYIEYPAKKVVALGDPNNVNTITYAPKDEIVWGEASPTDWEHVPPTNISEES